MLCYFLLYSKVNQLYVYIYPLFFRFFSHIGHSRVLIEFSRSLLVIYFMYNSVYMSVPISQFISPLPYSLVTISLFSTSVTLFLFCRKRPLCGSNVGQRGGNL